MIKMMAVMKILMALFRILCTILLVLLYLACKDAVSGLSADELWQRLTAHAVSDWQILAWAAGISLVLSLVRSLDIVWNVVFSALTFLLMAELVLIAAGLPAAITPHLHAYLAESGNFTGEIGNYPVFWWLIPSLWLVACLCARNQVAVFLTGVVCYGLWLLLTWLLTLGVNTWLSMGEPAPAQLADLFRAHSWLTAALTGTFLLVYALLMAVFESFLRSSNRKAEQPAA